LHFRKPSDIFGVMSVLVLLGIAVGMAMDTFAVALGLSCSKSGLDRGQGFRIAFHFGLFQFLMPVAGWATGELALKRIQTYDHWIASGLLVLVGGKMIVEFVKGGEKSGRKERDATRGASLIVLSLATSMDALAVGFGFGALRVPILYPASIIGLVTFVITMVGTKLGPALGKWAGRWAELAGGLILLAIAAKILIEHLT
jgi:putative Mn2+ efflux pump MntP